MRLPSLVSGTDLAVDLGTANTVVFRRGEGIVLFEPSVVAMDEKSGQVYAVGEKARQMLGRTPATIVATRPLRHGVITDFETTEQMLAHFVRRVGGGGMRRAIIVCVPSGLTQVERDAVVEATLGAGGRRGRLMREGVRGGRPPACRGRGGLARPRHRRWHERDGRDRARRDRRLDLAPRGRVRP